jgi:hypothetical protein
MGGYSKGARSIRGLAVLPLIIVTLLLVACYQYAGYPDLSNLPRPGPSASKGGARVQVEFRVTGSASRADVTYKVGVFGDPTNEQGVSVPWSASRGGYGGDDVYVTAEAHGGKIKCTVLVDDQALDSDTSNNDVPFCAAAGRVPTS